MKGRWPTGALVVAGALACGGTPEGPRAGQVLTTSILPDRVWVLDAGTGEVLDTIPVDPRPAEVDEPHGLAASPDGRHWFATLSHGESTFWKFETAGHRLVGRVALGTSGAARIGLTPDGRTAYVPDYYRDGDGAGEVASIAVEDLVVTRHRVCPGPHDAQVSPVGGLLAVACSLSDEVVVLDTGRWTERYRVRLGEAEAGAGVPMVKPLNVVWSPTGDRMFVTLHLAGAVVELDRSGSRVADVAVGAGPAQLALGLDGETLLVANRGEGSVSLIDVATLAERRIELGVDHPHGVAVSGDGRVGFVSFEGTTESHGGVVALDLASGTVLWRQDLGQYHLGVMYLTARSPGQ